MVKSVEEDICNVAHFTSHCYINGPIKSHIICIMSQYFKQLDNSTACLPLFFLLNFHFPSFSFSLQSVLLKFKPRTEGNVTSKILQYLLCNVCSQNTYGFHILLTISPASTIWTSLLTINWKRKTRDGLIWIMVQTKETQIYIWIK